MCTITTGNISGLSITGRLTVLPVAQVVEAAPAMAQFTGNIRSSATHATSDREVRPSEEETVAAEAAALVATFRD